jgi:hypothetical protein
MTTQAQIGDFDETYCAAVEVAVQVRTVLPTWKLRTRGYPIPLRLTLFQVKQNRLQRLVRLAGYLLTG